MKTQELFKKEHKLDFTLLADESGAVAKAFGVPVGKGGTFKTKIDGKDMEFIRGVSAKRWTFVIDKEGKIAYKNTAVKPGDDSKKVLEVLQKLK